MSLDYTSMDDEHKLIARYAAKLAAEAKVVSKYYFIFYEFMHTVNFMYYLN